MVESHKIHLAPSPMRQKVRAFNAQVFLASSGIARNIVHYRKQERIYCQGDAASTVMYIQDGGVKLSVVNKFGKEAVVGLLSHGDFFGEGCLAGLPFRIGIATAISGRNSEM